MHLKAAMSLLVDAARDWSKDNASMYAAALAYYTVFSMAPLLLIAVAIAGLLFGQQAAQGQLMGQLQGLIGPQGAQTIQQIMAGLKKPENNIYATLAGAVTLILGASGVFIQLQSALDSMWKIQVKPTAGIRALIRTRLLSFGVVAASGFLLLVSLIISAALSAVDVCLNRFFSAASFIAHTLNFLIGLAVTSAVFANIFKFLPDARTQWRDVWVGGLITALLFNIGRFLIGLYLGKSSVASSYGAAASLIIILLWVYYSALILFYGSEFTKVYSQRYGSKIIPAPHAEPRS